ncbi:MAG: S41 family peptidase [Flavobacteriaceae bacterium]|nr:S41 family peptidase [Flavobacteriaceae bacterium]
MNKKTLLLSYFLLLFIGIGCSGDDQDDIDAPLPVENIVTQINDFVWKGLNLFYLYQAEVPNLSDTRFATQTELNTFLSGFNSPDALFESLLYRRNDVDRFSVIVEDFIALEQSFQGISKTNGMDFRLTFLPGSQTNLVGFVRFVLPGSDAASKGIQRGDFFLTVNGTQLTVDNFSELLFGSGDTISLGMADFVDGNPPSFQSNGTSVSLTATVFTENPIFINKTFDIGGQKIGYLMYNGFVSNFDIQLNDVFGQFKNEGVTDLVLDLRYNPGGAVTSATRLASMITGQFAGQVFSRQIWNDKIQQAFLEDDPSLLEDKFVSSFNGNNVNSLNLSRVYIITTSSTASASELVINSLNPYIDVIQIGTNTTGKFQGSITLYDSDDFGRQGANPNHNYAMQPLVVTLANRDGVGEFFNGLTPDIQQQEFINELGVLGETNEPLLNIALNQITGASLPGRANVFGNQKPYNWELFKESNDFAPLGKEMYLDRDRIPLKKLKFE